MSISLNGELSIYECIRHEHVSSLVIMVVGSVSD